MSSPKWFVKLTAEAAFKKVVAKEPDTALRMLDDLDTPELGEVYRLGSQFMDQVRTIMGRRGAT